MQLAPLVDVLFLLVIFYCSHHSTQLPFVYNDAKYLLPKTHYH